MRKRILAVLSCSVLTFAMAQAPAGHWEITGAPVVTAIPEKTEGGYHLKNLRIASNDLTTLTEIVGKNERAVIQWSWDNPPGRIEPGKPVKIAARYIINEMVNPVWESSGSITVAFDVPGLAYGRGSDAAVKLLDLQVSPKTTRPGATKLITNNTVTAPNQSGDRVVRVAIGGAWTGPGYLVEYRFKWVP